MNEGRKTLNPLDLARAAYQGYCESTGGVSLISGSKLPPFEELAGPIQAAWVDAASKVACIALNHAREIIAASGPSSTNS